MPRRLMMPASRLERAAALERKLRAEAFDIIHDMGCGWHADVFHPHGGSTRALWEHNLLRIPRWRQIRIWRENRYRETAEIERRQHAKSDARIVAVSQFVKKHFETLHQLPAERLRLIYNGVDSVRFSPEHRALHRKSTRHELGVKDEVLFLMLAHNLLLKNARTLIEATARLVKAGIPVKVCIAGGKKPKAFIELAKRLGVGDAITFLGLVDPIPLFAAADAYVHPTWYDPCSLVTLEAFASALPVITTRFNGASELMKSEEHGFIINDPADVLELVSKMTALIDPATRANMGAAARAMVLDHSLARQTEEFLALYKEITKQRGAV